MVATSQANITWSTTEVVMLGWTVSKQILCNVLECHLVLPLLPSCKNNLPLQWPSNMHSRGTKWTRGEEQGTDLVGLGLPHDLDGGLLGVLPLPVPGLGPYTVASTTILPCAQRAQSWARWSRFPVQVNSQSWFRFCPSARLPPSIIPYHYAPVRGVPECEMKIEA
jgi:hypothetical protein